MRNCKALVSCQGRFFHFHPWLVYADRTLFLKAYQERGLGTLS